MIDLAGIALVIAAAGGPIATIVVAVINGHKIDRGATEAAAASKLSAAKVAEVHTLVNSKFSTAVERNVQLEEALTEAGIQVPPEHST